MAHTPHIDGPRACGKSELPQVIALVDAAMRQGSDQSLLTDYPLVYLDENLPNIRIITVDGRVAAVVPFIRWPALLDARPITVGIISPTATAPEHRHKGFGLACVNDCVRIMQETACELSVLWTRPATFPFYQHAGYFPVASPGYTYSCSRDDAPLFAAGPEPITPYDPATRRFLPDLEALHRQDPAGLQRTTARSAILFSLPKMQTLLALRHGQPVAYLVVSRAMNKPGFIEAAGEESALETLLHHALAGLQPQETPIAHVGLADTAFSRLLSRVLPTRRTPMPAHQMMRLNTPQSLPAGVDPTLLPHHLPIPLLDRS